MILNKVLKYILKIAPSISYWKIILYSVIIIAIIELIIFLLNLKRTAKIKLPRLNLYCLILYSNFVLRLTLLGRIFGSKTSEYLKLNVSLGEIFSTHGILNIILFVPFGFFIYLLLRNYEIPIRVILTTLFSFGFTLAIEMIQLVTKSGRFEINDIIANGLGGILGCLPGILLFDYILSKDHDDYYE